MRRNLIVILFVIIFSLTACSSNSNPIEAPVVNEEIDEIDNEVNGENENIEIKIEPKKEVKEENEVELTQNIQNAEDNSNLNESELNQEKNTTDSLNEDVIDKEVELSSEKESTNVLKIRGLVEKELFLTLDELKAMEDILYEADFYSLNSFGTKGYTHFKGVNLWSLINLEAIISGEPTKVTVIAQDGYEVEFTIDEIKRQDYIDETNPDAKYPIIISWEENGEEYSTDKGAPFKLVVGQKEPGDVNKPQWVSNIDRIVIE